MKAKLSGMKTKLSGTIGTYVVFKPGKTFTETAPLKILNNYISCDGVPLHWTQLRLAELSSAIQWALNEIPPDVIETQTDLEKDIDE